MSILNNTQVVDRTEAINLVKPVPQLISSLGLFKAAPVATNVIQFDYKEDTFNILSDKQRNTVGKNVMTPESYQLHSLPILIILLKIALPIPNFLVFVVLVLILNEPLKPLLLMNWNANHCVMTFITSIYVLQCC